MSAFAQLSEQYRNMTVEGDDTEATATSRFGSTHRVVSFDGGSVHWVTFDDGFGYVEVESSKSKLFIEVQRGKRSHLVQLYRLRVSTTGALAWGHRINKATGQIVRRSRAVVLTGYDLRNVSTIQNPLPKGATS